MKKIFFGLALLILGGCATTPSAPPVAPISIQLKGTAVEVQNFIEQTIPYTHGVYAKNLKIINADNRSITFQTDCLMNVEGMGAFSCTMILMAVGNSGWDGPFLNITYRTNEIREEVTVTMQSQWCASNLVGKTNCMKSNLSEEKSNQHLLDLKKNYEIKVRKL
jgi:hypothetical protein